MYIKKSKTTLTGKAIAAVSWVLTIGLISFSALLIVIEELELTGLLIAGLYAVAGSGVFLGLQRLSTIIDDRLLTARKAGQTAAPAATQYPGSAGHQSSQPTAGQHVSRPSDAFFAAGKHYYSVLDLQVTPAKQTYVWLDVHGRAVACCRERFPCFDSFDYLYEDRYFHWYFIWHDGSWTKIHSSDDSKAVKVEEGLTTELVLAAWRGPRDAAQAVMNYVQETNGVIR